MIFLVGDFSALGLLLINFDLVDVGSVDDVAGRTVPFLVVFESFLVVEVFLFLDDFLELLESSASLLRIGLDDTDFHVDFSLTSIRLDLLDLPFKNIRHSFVFGVVFKIQIIVDEVIVVDAFNIFL